MKIRPQLTFIQFPIAIIIVFLTIFFIFSISDISKKIESIVDNNFQKIVSLQKIDNYLEQLNVIIKSQEETRTKELKNLENKIDQELIIQEKAEKESMEEKDLTASLRNTWEAYMKGINSPSPGNHTDTLYKEINQIMDNIFQINQDALIQKKETLSNFIMDYRFFVLFTSLICLTFSFFVSWIFTGLILNPLNKMIEIVSQFGKSDETVLLHIKGSEEIEKLSEEFNLMTNRLEAYHQSSLGHVIEDFETLKGAFDALPDPFLLFDHNYDIIFMNHAASHLFGISGTIKKKNPFLYFEKTVRESLLKLVQKTFLAYPQKTHPHEYTEETIEVMGKRTKRLFVPTVFPVKNNAHSKITGVLIWLQDLRHKSQFGKELEGVCKTFISDFYGPLWDIHMALHSLLQRSTGPLTVKQKELLYIARENCDELEKTYKEFCKIPEIGGKNKG